jgi:hypothetical protein
VGVVEGLEALLRLLPDTYSLSDKNLLSFISEVLKMMSVADGEMSDSSLKDFSVDRNGYTVPYPEGDSLCPTHASGLFLRRECLFEMADALVVVPEELPVGVQLRVSGIKLLHTMIRANSEPFFDAEVSTPIGKISTTIRMA